MATVYHRSGDKKRLSNEFRRDEEAVIGSLCRLGSRPISPKTQLEQEKRIRREIANSNERRRMQSINAGFQSLRTLLPHHEGEKLSKAAILQHTAEYIYQLEQEKTRLLSQNCQLKRLVNSQLNHDSDGSCSDSPIPKRKKIETVESADEGIGNMSPAQNEQGVDDVRREMVELRVHLDRERKLRMVLEEQMRTMEAQMYPERIREIAHHVQLQYERGEDNPLSDIPASLNITLDAELTSPHSAMSSEEMDSSHENTGVETSPEHSTEVPEDLSGRVPTKLPLPLETVVKTEPLSMETVAVESPIPLVVSTIDAPVINIPSPPPMSTTPLVTAIAVESLTPLQPLLYSASTSRQNLETIVEAIRHLEGDHLFQDDPEPLGSTSQIVLDGSAEQMVLDNRCIKTQSELSHSSCVNEDFAFHHQIIQNAPITQLRPGVIVSNHS